MQTGVKSAIGALEKSTTEGGSRANLSTISLLDPGNLPQDFGVGTGVVNRWIQFPLLWDPKKKGHNIGGQSSVAGMSEDKTLWFLLIILCLVFLMFKCTSQEKMYLIKCTFHASHSWLIQRLTANSFMIE